MDQSRNLHLDAIVSAVLVGLLIAAEAGALSFGLIWPLGGFLGVSDTYIPAEVIASAAIGLSIGWRAGRVAYHSIAAAEDNGDARAG